MSGQMRTVKVDYEEDRGPTGREYEPGPRTEIDVSVQRLALLVPTNEVEPLSEPDEKESVTEDVTTDDVSSQDRRDSAKEAGLEEVN